jgi:hypothetical protein
MNRVTSFDGTFFTTLNYSLEMIISESDDPFVGLKNNYLQSSVGSYILQREV